MQLLLAYMPIFSFSLTTECGLKFVAVLSVCYASAFIQLNNWMWIETVGTIKLIVSQRNFHPVKQDVD